MSSVWDRRLMSLHRARLGSSLNWGRKVDQLGLIKVVREQKQRFSPCCACLWASLQSPHAGEQPRHTLVGGTASAEPHRVTPTQSFGLLCALTCCLQSCPQDSKRDRWMDKEDMVRVCNGILPSLKKDWNDAICRNTDGPRDYQSELSQIQRKTNIWYCL